MIQFKSGPNPRKIKEVEVTPSQKDNLMTFMKTFMRDDQTRSKKPKKKGNSKVVKTKDPTPAHLPHQRKPRRYGARRRRRCHRPLLLLQVRTK